MITLSHDSIRFEFPQAHPDAQMSLHFQRTLRLPDDGREYPLPAGLGRFPLKHVDDFARWLPPQWVEHGGLMMPMYQSEAMWIMLEGHSCRDRGTAYPFAVKVAAGKINAVTGELWRQHLNRDPQDYMVVPRQPWLDGFCVKRGTIRQFVATPLGDGCSVEEQATGRAEWGGLQIAVYPMRGEVFERRFPKPTMGDALRQLTIDRGASLDRGGALRAKAEMSLGMGGLMRQEVYEDRYSLSDWDIDQGGRVYMHILNSQHWYDVTGEFPPQKPLTSRDYERAGIPWFEYYDDAHTPVKGSLLLAGLKSIKESMNAMGKPHPHDQSITPVQVRQLRAGLRPDEVREGTF